MASLKKSSEGEIIDHKMSLFNKDLSWHHQNVLLVLSFLKHKRQLLVENCQLQYSATNHKSLNCWIPLTFNLLKLKF